MIELNRAYHADCFDVFPPIQDKSIDMVLCDLPYGTTHCTWDTALPFTPLWEQYKRVVKDNGAILLFSAQPFTTDLITSNRKMFRYEIVWEKTQVAGFLNANKMPMRVHENIAVFYKHLPTYNPQMQAVKKRDVGRMRKQSEDRAAAYGKIRTGAYTETGERYPRDVVRFSNWNGALFGKTENATVHPTQKPVDLCEYLINTYSNAGDVVLDNCAGSMTTGIACQRTSRDFICIEKDAEIYKIGAKRLEENHVSIDENFRMSATEHGSLGLLKEEK